MGNEASKKETGQSKTSTPERVYPVLRDLTANLNNHRKETLFCDVMLIVGEKVFRAHRNILAATSPFFTTMFTSNFAEAKDRKCILGGVSVELMPAILDFIYTGEIQIDEEIVAELLHDAHQLQVTALVEACFLYLEEHMAVHNAVTTYGLAQKYSNDDLKAKAKAYILKFFPAVSQTYPFLDLPSDDVLVEFLKDDQLNVDSEDVVCDAAFRWLHRDETRTRLFAGVLEHVRLHFVSTNLLHKIDEEEEIIKKSPHCSDLVKQALFNKLLTKGKNKEKPRKFYAENNKK